MRGRDDEALARSLDYEAARATNGDDTCCQHLDNHGFLLLTSIIYHRCLTIIFLHLSHPEVILCRLPKLTLDDAQVLSKWARRLSTPTPTRPKPGAG